jgi:hypothetical protein
METAPPEIPDPVRSGVKSFDYADRLCPRLSSRSVATRRGRRGGRRCHRHFTNRSDWLSSRGRRGVALADPRSQVKRQERAAVTFERSKALLALRFHRACVHRLFNLGHKYSLP